MTPLSGVPGNWTCPRSGKRSHRLLILLIPNSVRIIRHVCLPMSARSCQVARARGLIPMYVSSSPKVQAQRVACEHKVAQPLCLSRRSALSALDGMNERLVVHRNLFRSSGSTQALLHIHEGYLCRAFIRFTSFSPPWPSQLVQGATLAPSAELRQLSPSCSSIGI